MSLNRAIVFDKAVMDHLNTFSLLQMKFFLLKMLQNGSKMGSIVMSRVLRPALVETHKSLLFYFSFQIRKELIMS